MELFTIAISRWRVARQYKIEMVDTTVKGKNPLFAPTWDLVMGSKQGEITPEEYRIQYRRLMIDSWKRYRPQWEEFLRREDPVAIACYCPAGAFCHRLVLKDIFEELCGLLNIEFRYYGELD